MRKLITLSCFVFAFFMLQQVAIAQPKNALSFRYVRYNYTQPNPAIKDWQDIYSNAGGSGVQFAYQRLVQKNTYFVLPATIGVGSYPVKAGGYRENLLVNVDALFQFHLLKFTSLLNPVLHLGLGSTWETRDNRADFNMPAGLGLHIRLNETFSLSAQSQYRFSIQNRNGWQHSIGFVAYLGEEVTDRDGDGIKDQLDKCPDVPGIPSLLGCPDRDMDGIGDADDKCPDVPGVAERAGCPDKDGDGIGDAVDKCPDVAGVAAFQGCPDTDSDGIADQDDKCPREAGPVSNNGCPFRDRDADGIEDAMDLCPDVAGPASTKGCPDKDGDGITDKEDACPTEKGEARFKGCPDTDGDGVPDKDDRCVNVPGPISNKGCPEIKKEDKAKVELAVKAVQFETGKNILLESSKKVLDEVATVLIKYPAYSLTISGHTDAVGDDKMNQVLSERRAKAVADYLISKSVAANRLISAGYGETKPIADNKTKEGRELNRRVEFDLKIN